MTLPKFKAGRIHQMRTNKSYLLAQTDWSSQGRDVTCDRCGQEPQTFEHVVSRCVALEHARRGLDPDAFDVSEGSKLWKCDKAGRKLMGVFSSFVMKHRLNFPIRLGVFPFTRGSNLGS